MAEARLQKFLALTYVNFFKNFPLPSLLLVLSRLTSLFLEYLKALSQKLSIQGLHLHIGRVFVYDIMDEIGLGAVFLRKTEKRPTAPKTGPCSCSPTALVFTDL